MAEQYEEWCNICFTLPEELPTVAKRKKKQEKKQKNTWPRSQVKGRRFYRTTNHKKAAEILTINIHFLEQAVWRRALHVILMVSARAAVKPLYSVPDCMLNAAAGV